MQANAGEQIEAALQYAADVESVDKGAIRCARPMQKGNPDRCSGCLAYVRVGGLTDHDGHQTIKRCGLVLVQDIARAIRANAVAEQQTTAAVKPLKGTA